MKYHYLSDPVFSAHRSDSFTQHKAPLHPATAASVSGTITQLCSIRPEGLSAFWGDLTENQIILWLPFFGNTMLFSFIQTGNNKKNFLLRPLSLFGIVSLSHAFCSSGREWLKCKSMHRLWLRTLYTFGCYSMRVAVSISEWMHCKTPTSDKSRGLFYFYFFFCWKPAVVRFCSNTSAGFPPRCEAECRHWKCSFRMHSHCKTFALNPDSFLDFLDFFSFKMWTGHSPDVTYMCRTATWCHTCSTLCTEGNRDLGNHRCEHIPFHF